MGFQTTVSLTQGAGIPGEFYVTGPRRAQSYIVDSADPTYNVAGRAFSKTAEGKCAAGNAGGTAQFAGIFVNPKSQALYGTLAGGPLAPSLTVPDYTQIECATEGTVFVILPAPASLGDLIVYDNTTGELSAISPGAALPGGKSFAFAFVDYNTVSAAGLAIITLTPTLAIPVPA